MYRDNIEIKLKISLLEYYYLLK